MQSYIYQICLAAETTRRFYCNLQTGEIVSVLKSQLLVIHVIKEMRFETPIQIP